MNVVMYRKVMLGWVCMRCEQLGPLHPERDTASVEAGFAAHELECSNKRPKTGVTQ